MAPDDDPDDRPVNPSGNRSLGDIVRTRFERRSLLRIGTVLGAAAFVGVGYDSLTSSHDKVSRTTVSGLLGFTAVAASSDDTVQVPVGYRAQVLIPWGTPIRSTAPAWRKDASNSAVEQSQQVGTHHDGLSYFPADGADGNRRGLLVLNHEYSDHTLLHADGDEPMSREKSDKTLAALGVTIIEVAESAGQWAVVDSPRNRRITGVTPVTFSGPVGPDHPAIRGDQPPLGTLNNCSNGTTPWGTYLACEENFNLYFGTDAAGWSATAELARYGLTADGGGYRLHTVDPRFDLAANTYESNRFGWVVEMDPKDPTSTPVKRTALGRFKHESATLVESNGRVVVYSGDDQDGEYIYKFVGDEPWRDVMAGGRSPLDVGTLFVATFNDDGSGQWRPLRFGAGPLTAGSGWRDQADVLRRTRQAADAVGATRLDRAEWIAVHPTRKGVYASLTNGSGWGGAVTPRSPNPYGHIICWRERDDDNTATLFTWEIFLLAGDPAHDRRATVDDADVFGSPDGLWFDPDGRLWIQTDVSNFLLGDAASGHDRIGNNAMLAADPDTGDLRRFLVGPRGAEISGIAMTPDQRTMFVNVQHPGEATSAIGSPTARNPRVVSNWPDHDPAGRPRSATVVIRRTDGGKVGT